MEEASEQNWIGGRADVAVAVAPRFALTIRTNEEAAISEPNARPACEIGLPCIANRQLVKWDQSQYERFFHFFSL
jgi:hypothetical protein